MDVALSASDQSVSSVSQTNKPTNETDRQRRKKNILTQNSNARLRLKLQKTTKRTPMKNVCCSSTFQGVVCIRSVARDYVYFCGIDSQ
jgi:hypothetical protein